MVTTSINQTGGDDNVSLRHDDKQVIVKVERAVDSASGLTFILSLVLLCLFALTYIQVTDMNNTVKQNNRILADIQNRVGLTSSAVIPESTTTTTVTEKVEDTKPSNMDNFFSQFPLPGNQPNTDSAKNTGG